MNLPTGGEGSTIAERLRKKADEKKKKRKTKEISFQRDKNNKLK